MITRKELETIGQKLALGAVPRELPLIAGGDWGVGRSCVVCEDMIATDQAEVTADFRGAEPHVFHVRCFLQWWELVEANRGRR